MQGFNGRLKHEKTLKSGGFMTYCVLERGDSNVCQLVVKTAGVFVASCDQCQSRWSPCTPCLEENGLDHLDANLGTDLSVGVPRGPRAYRNVGSQVQTHERYPPRPVATILERQGVVLNAISSLEWPARGRRQQEVNFKEIRMPEHRDYDQYTSLDRDPKGAQAARQNELDFAQKLGAVEPRPVDDAF